MFWIHATTAHPEQGQGPAASCHRSSNLFLRFHRFFPSGIKCRFSVPEISPQPPGCFSGEFHHFPAAGAWSRSDVLLLLWACCLELSSWRDVLGRRGVGARGLEQSPGEGKTQQVTGHRGKGAPGGGHLPLLRELLFEPSLSRARCISVTTSSTVPASKLSLPQIL